jgi:2-iminobutanoate/2-iminopropanoate deaminase
VADGDPAPALTHVLASLSRNVKAEGRQNTLRATTVLPMSEPAKPVGPYTPVVRAGDWLVVSGQVGLLDGRIVAGGVAGEMAQAMRNLEAQLASQGASLDQVVKTTVFLRHMSDYARMNEAYTAALGDHRPARSAIGVAELPMGALVEVEAWAWVGE